MQPKARADTLKSPKFRRGIADGVKFAAEFVLEFSLEFAVEFAFAEFEAEFLLSQAAKNPAPKAAKATAVLSFAEFARKTRRGFVPEF